MEAFDQLKETVHRLRAPGGCPWDRAQTHQSLRPFLIEEAYEVLAVLDEIHSSEDLRTRDKLRRDFCEELGDLLMQVVLHAEMTDEVGAFNLEDVVRGLNEKLIRRHPHVFGDATAKDQEEVLQNWEKQKAKEKARAPDTSILDGLPKALPALQRTERLIEKVSKVGFQWKNIRGPFEKLEEEVRELKAEIDAGHSLERMQDELGDVLFCAANLAHFLKVHPEDALRGTLARFETRFRYVETKLKERGKLPEDSTLEEMDALWDEAKRQKS